MSLGHDPSRPIWPLVSSEAEYFTSRIYHHQACIPLIAHIYNSASNYLINNMLIKL